VADIATFFFTTKLGQNVPAAKAITIMDAMMYNLVLLALENNSRINSVRLSLENNSRNILITFFILTWSMVIFI
jgi:hypothetical protein